MRINRFWLVATIFAAVGAGLAGIEISLSLGRGDHTNLVVQTISFASLFGAAVTFFFFAFLFKENKHGNKNTVGFKDTPTDQKPWRN